jgi:hypothetical protein
MDKDDCKTVLLDKLMRIIPDQVLALTGLRRRNIDAADHKQELAIEDGKPNENDLIAAVLRY